jgi:hypothetical protein
MSQITPYLDDATQALVEPAAQANGLSKSRWVSEIILRGDPQGVQRERHKQQPSDNDPGAVEQTIRQIHTIWRRVDND